MLSEIERLLLHHYSRRERVIYWGMRRSLQHQRLLAFGYIREENRDIRALAVSLTPAGRAALEDGPGAA
jgi:hypothetical protein